MSETIVRSSTAKVALMLIPSLLKDNNQASNGFQSDKGLTLLSKPSHTSIKQAPIGISAGTSQAKVEHITYFQTACDAHPAILTIGKGDDVSVTLKLPDGHNNLNFKFVEQSPASRVFDGYNPSGNELIGRLAAGQLFFDTARHMCRTLTNGTVGQHNFPKIHDKIFGKITRLCDVFINDERQLDRRSSNNPFTYKIESTVEPKYPEGSFIASTGLSKIEIVHDHFLANDKKTLYVSNPDTALAYMQTPKGLYKFQGYDPDTTLSAQIRAFSEVTSTEELDSYLTTLAQITNSFRYIDKN